MHFNLHIKLSYYFSSQEMGKNDKNSEENNVRNSSYPEKRSTWNVTTDPSKFTGLLRSSVISNHSLFSPSEFKNNTLTRHVEGSGVPSWSLCSDTGN